MKFFILTLLFLMPVLAFSQKAKNDSVTLKVFVPTFDQKSCDYLEMLITSFKYYFHDGFAFENKKDCRVKIEFNVKSDTGFTQFSSIQIDNSIPVYFDRNRRIFEKNGIRIPLNLNDDATVVLLNAQNKVIFTDSTYRAQGEHLKPLETKIKELLGVKPLLSKIVFSKTLKVGDVAPDVFLRKNLKLSDLRGNVVVLSFYPAAFSGSNQTSLNAQLDKMSISCIGQISSLATIQPTFKIQDILTPRHEVFAITSSTEALIQLWRISLSSLNIQFLNDEDYTISKTYNSYNQAGFNNRYTYIISKDGKIAYANPSFYFGDEAQIQSIIQTEMAKY